LYVLNYGNGFFGQNQPGAELVRIDYVGPAKGKPGKNPHGNHAPSVEVDAEGETIGLAPLTVSFSSEASDPEGQPLTYEWDFDADGAIDSNDPNPTFTFTENGVYNATLQVTDKFGKSASDYVVVVVGNIAPVVEFITPQNGDTFSFGDAVAYEVMVTDNTAVDCSRVQVTYILGHNTHGHPQTTAFGCTGTIQTTFPAGHDPTTDNLSGVFVASYTDDPGGGLPALTGTDEVVLQPTAP
jgi:hypothetical protein